MDTYPDPSGYVSNSATQQRLERRLWVGHAYDEAKIAFLDAVATCPEKMRSAMTGGIDKAFAGKREGTLKKCRKHLGDPYDPAESTCFMQARKLGAMKACGFKIANEGKDDDENPDRVFEDIREMCDKAREDEQREGE